MLTSRNGRRQLGRMPPRTASGLAYMIRKLVVVPGENPVTFSTNPRYIGVQTGTGQILYRSVNWFGYDLVAEDINTVLGAQRKAFDVTDFGAGISGGQWGFIASELKMLKDRIGAFAPGGPDPYVTLKPWGILPAFGVAVAQTVMSIAPNGPDGGTQLSPNGSQPYDYVYTYKALDTFNEGNPSRVMLTDSQAGTVRPEGAITSSVLNVGGAGYAIGDTGYVNTANGGAFYEVVTVGGGGDVTSYVLTDGGIGYVVSSGVTTTRWGDQPGIGAGFTIDILTIGGSYTGTPISAHQESIQVTVWGTETAITSPISSIRIYRRGGLLYDAWRLVGQIANPGAGLPAVFIDTLSDSDLLNSGSAVLETDNDAPVTSTVPYPIAGKMKSSTLGNISPGRQIINVTMVAGQLAQLLPGTLMHIPYDAPEDVIIEQIDYGASTITAYFQHPHIIGIDGTDWQVDAIAGQPCYLTTTHGQYVVVAGDPNNPHLLYRSKASKPESFPVIAADGTNTTAVCGSPANPIKGLANFRGTIVTLNLLAIYETMISQGSFVQPAQVANRGTVGRRAWCQTETDIWFLAPDGVWSWDGGACRKRSDAIEPLFHGQPVNEMQPLDFSKPEACVMDTRRGQIFLIYADIDGTTREIACEPGYGDRWRQIDVANPAATFSYTEQDTMAMIQASADPVSVLMNVVDSSVVATGAVSSAILNAGGSGYAPGDIGFINGGNAGATYRIATVAGGVVVTFTLTAVGSAYSNGTNIATTTTAGVGSGFTVDITAASAAIQYTSDGYENNPQTEGTAIPLDLIMPWIDLGVPMADKLFEEVFLELDSTGSSIAAAVPAALSVEVRLNYNEAPVDTFTIPAATPGRRLASLLPRSVAGPPVKSYGREARAISFRIYGFAYPTRISFFSLHFQYEETGMLTSGGATDWMDLGYQHDKKLYQMVVEFDVEGIDRTIELDVLKGREGNVANYNVQTFTLSNPVMLGAGRALKSFPVADVLVGPVKMVRLRPSPTQATAGAAATALFKIQKVDFEKEEYPPDVVTFTKWDTKGYEYQTFCNQVTLDVNTNGQTITVKLQSDGTSVFTFTVNTTEFDRQRRITVPTNTTGYQWRLYTDPTQANLAPGSTGLFQLWGHSLKLQQADKGEVGHTFDWDEIGHPWDKYLQTVTVEWDATGGGDVTLQLDTLGGINGQVYTAAVHTFVLTGGRGRRVFPLNPDIVCKMVRLYPVPGPIPVLFRQWKYFFEKFDFPADIWRSTPWKHSENPNDENPTWLWIDSDTQNVPAAVQLRNEDGTVMSFNHTGTLNDRKKNYPIPVDIFARQWRLIIAEGTGGKFQLFTWGFQRWSAVPNESGTDPAEVILWTPWSDFSWPYDKLARNLILRVNTGGVPATVHLQTAESGTVQTFTVNQGYTDRPVHYPCHSNLIGKMWRLVIDDPRPAGGLFQLWSWDLDNVREPAAVSHWDSYESTLGYRGWKVLKQAWLMYACESPVKLSIISDTGTYTQWLPAHPLGVPSEFYEPDPSARAVERFYLPDAFSSGLNKSKLYRIVVDSALPFKFYVQGSGVEWLACGGDRRASYQQMSLSEFATFGEGAAQASAA